MQDKVREFLKSQNGYDVFIENLNKTGETKMSDELLEIKKYLEESKMKKIAEIDEIDNQLAKILKLIECEVKTNKQDNKAKIECDKNVDSDCIEDEYIKTFKSVCKYIGQKNSSTLGQIIVILSMHPNIPQFKIAEYIVKYYNKNFIGNIKNEIQRIQGNFNKTLTENKKTIFKTENYFNWSLNDKFKNSNCFKKIESMCLCD